MSFLLLRPFSRPLTIGLGLTSLLTAHSILTSPPRSFLLRCDSSPAASAGLGSLRDEFTRYKTEARNPVVTEEGRLNPRAVKEFTKGSIAGMCFACVHVCPRARKERRGDSEPTQGHASRDPTLLCHSQKSRQSHKTQTNTPGAFLGLLGGVAVSFFSKPLALLIGILVLGAQALESRGIRIIPYSRLQNLFAKTNVRRALEDNVALKVSFGLAFALAGFMEF